MSSGPSLNAIAPARGAKYSVNLHAFLTTKRMAPRAHLQRVYRDAEGTLWLGYKDESFIFGARLMHVLCKGARTETFAHPRHGKSVEVADFWPRYAAVGRCAIDTDHSMHFIGDEHRWHVDGETRSCLWCGKAVQRLERWVEPVERERWVPVDPVVRAPATATA